MITGENVVVFVVSFYTRYYYIIYIIIILCGVLAVCSRVLYSRIRMSIKFGIKGSERKVVLPDLWSVYVQF
jgi:hypothetical protein